TLDLCDRSDVATTVRPPVLAQSIGDEELRGAVLRVKHGNHVALVDRSYGKLIARRKLLEIRMLDIDETSVTREFAVTQNQVLQWQGVPENGRCFGRPFLEQCERRTHAIDLDFNASTHRTSSLLISVATLQGPPRPVNSRTRPRSYARHMR